MFLESVLTFLSSQAYKAKTPKCSVKLQPNHHTNLSLVRYRKNKGKTLSGAKPITLIIDLKVIRI